MSRLEKILDGITDVRQERISEHASAQISGVVHLAAELVPRARGGAECGCASADREEDP